MSTLSNSNAVQIRCLDVTFEHDPPSLKSHYSLLIQKSKTIEVYARLVSFGRSPIFYVAFTKRWLDTRYNHWTDFASTTIPINNFKEFATSWFPEFINQAEFLKFVSEDVNKSDVISNGGPVCHTGIYISILILNFEY